MFLPIFSHISIRIVAVFMVIYFGICFSGSQLIAAPIYFIAVGGRKGRRVTIRSEPSAILSVVRRIRWGVIISRRMVTGRRVLRGVAGRSSMATSSNGG
jgi:hypothetical protein